MYRIQLVARAYQALFVVMIFFLVQGSNAYSKEKDCWADFFEHSQYTGKNFLLEGPTQLENLKNIDGENWDSRIDSLKVGPKAKLIVYDNPDFKLMLREMAKYPELMRSMGVTEKDIKEEDQLFFNANAKIHDLSDFNFHQKIRSLKIECN
ncbi:MAG: hypothetical protein HOP23_16040 [Methylococcaceae bacterium]|nr:hypothetical protein [Methylococcaceae bacterium]